MKAVVLGSKGKQGKAVTYCLNRNGVTVVGMDMEVSGLSVIDLGIRIAKRDPDVVVSCLPYTENWYIAQECINRGLRWCDLGGHYDTDLKINRHALGRATAPVFTGLGLAPGLINIIAERLVDEHIADLGTSPESVEMFCGGLPRDPKTAGPLKYALSFSIDGLLNEYFGRAHALVDGEIVKVDGMKDIQGIRIFDTILEAFNTGGCANPKPTLKSMQSKGVRDARYQTLRYPGHAARIRTLHEIHVFYPPIIEGIKQACPQAGPFHPDEIFLKVEAGRKYQDMRLIGPVKGFTAMQVATAFPTAIIARQMAEGRYDRYQPRRVITYDDVKGTLYDDFLETFDDLTNPVWEHGE